MWAKVNHCFCISILFVVLLDALLLLYLLFVMVLPQHKIPHSTPENTLGAEKAYSALGTEQGSAGGRPIARRSEMDAMGMAHWCCATSTIDDDAVRGPGFCPPYVAGSS